MADTTQYNFVMNIDGEDAFEVLRFGFDRAGFHAGSIWEAESDSLHQPRSNLQILCSVIEAQKTMLFTRMSDLTTIRLVETFLQKKTLDRIFFVVTETANGARTPTWVAALNLTNVSIVDLRTRQLAGVLPGGQRLLIDVVSLRANEASERDYDSQGIPQLTYKELMTERGYKMD
jgi:hypothetical protein